MSNSSARNPKSPSPSPFHTDLNELAAQVAEEENVMPTSEEVLRRGFDWKTITGAYGGDNLQADFETIRKFDHKRMDTVAVALKVRRILHPHLLPPFDLLLTFGLISATTAMYSTPDTPSHSLLCFPRSKIAMFVSTFSRFSIESFKVRIFPHHPLLSMQP